jgi:uncharacterized ion transporter superfamily protein YfcC
MPKKFPSAFTILFFLIIVVASLTWLIPAGQYERVFNPVLDREAPVPGTYHEVPASPQGLWQVLMAPIAGLYDPATGKANAIDVAVFVLVIGGFLGVVTRTGAIDAGIGGLLKALKGREILMIPILMIAFAAGGTTYGMAEESLAFYAIILPIFLRAGYDTLTGVAVIMLGAGIGTLGSTVNAFATVIASNAAGVPFTDGLLVRIILLVLCLAAGIFFVMRYAARVHANPAASVVADQHDDNLAHFLKGAGRGDALPEFSNVRSLILILFGVTFAVMLYGVIKLGWWMAEMSALFLGMSILIWIVAKFSPETRMDEEGYITTFVNGAKDLLSVALIIGVARGIIVIMDAGKITDTILHAREEALSGLSAVAFVNRMLLNQTLLSFLVPSSSGLAVLSMPILAPLADFAGVARSLVVSAYQSANGWVNLFNPTFAVVMGGLAIGRVSYNRWLRFLWPLLVVLMVIIILTLSIAAMLSDKPAVPAPSTPPAATTEPAPAPAQPAPTPTQPAPG